MDLKTMGESSALMRAALERRLVREYCDICYGPSIFESLGQDGPDNTSQKQKKADAMFEEIMASPEKIKSVVVACCEASGGNQE